MILAKTERVLTAIGASSTEIRFYVRRIEEKLRLMPWPKRVWTDLRTSSGVILILIAELRRRK